MSQFIPEEANFTSLKNKVVVLTGGASGIGAATVTLLHNAGASIVFGDIAKDSAEKLVSALQPSEVAGGHVEFVPCDVTKYNDIYSLFRTAHSRYGHIDHAISCAGILEQGKWFDPELTVETVGKEQATTAVIDVNVLGSANFARIAVVFLEDQLQKGENKSLTLLSSVNAFRESPGLYMYQTSKHAIQGLMRSMRKPIFDRGVRVNCVCPGVTDTPMTHGIVDIFKQNGLFWQTADDVAKIILGIEITEGMNGKAFYIEGGKAFEFEDTFYATQPQWLGEEPTKMMRINTEAVNRGALIRK